MFFGFGKPQRKLENMLDALAACGIALRPDVPLEALYRPKTKRQYKRDRSTFEKNEDGYFQLLLAMAAARYDAQSGRLLGPISDDIYYSDIECIADAGDYTAVVERMCLLTRGDLVLEDIRDHYDYEQRVAWVEWTYNGKREHFDLEVDEEVPDYMDTELFSVLSERLVATGSPRHFSSLILGQAALKICQPPENVERLQKLTKLPWT